MMRLSTTQGLEAGYIQPSNRIFFDGCAASTSVGPLFKTASPSSPFVCWVYPYELLDIVRPGAEDDPGGDCDGNSSSGESPTDFLLTVVVDAGSFT
jgi:hypothetical protein